MKKILITLTKTIIFFIGWALLAGLLPIPENNNPAIWRFWAELIPFLCIVVLTFAFWLIEKRKIKLYLIAHPLKNSIIGVGIGLAWLGSVVVILMVLGVMRILEYNAVSMIGVWLFSAFINTIMQELLVRGYLYQMIKTNYNIVIAVVITTALFTFMHGGAFEAGIIPVLNVLTMSLLMSVILEYTQSLIAPIITHFIWNGVGAIVLGGVSLAEDYPHLLTSEFVGNVLLTGGTAKIEGSFVVFIANAILILVFLLLIKKRSR